MKESRAAPAGGLGAEALSIAQTQARILELLAAATNLTKSRALAAAGTAMAGEFLRGVSHRRPDGTITRLPPESDPRPEVAEAAASMRNARASLDETFAAEENRRREAMKAHRDYAARRGQAREWRIEIPGGTWAGPFTLAELRDRLPASGWGNARVSGPVTNGSPTKAHEIPVLLPLLGNRAWGDLAAVPGSACPTVLRNTPMTVVMDDFFPLGVSRWEEGARFSFDTHPGRHKFAVYADKRKLASFPVLLPPGQYRAHLEPNEQGGIRCRFGVVRGSGA